MKDFELAIRAVYRKDYEFLIAFLAECGPSGVDEQGRTLLMHAVLAANADVEMIRFLIEHGVSVTACDSDQKWTALHFAARDKHSKIVELLLTAGADVAAVDVHGNTALGRSLDSLPHDRQTIELLIDAGSDPTRKNCHGSSPLDVARLMENAELEALLLPQ